MNLSQGAKLYAILYPGSNFFKLRITEQEKYCKAAEKIKKEHSTFND
jgi:hypothetical protein